MSVCFKKRRKHATKRDEYNTARVYILVDLSDNNTTTDNQKEIKTPTGQEQARP